MEMNTANGKGRIMKLWMILGVVTIVTCLGTSGAFATVYVTGQYWISDPVGHCYEPWIEDDYSTIGLRADADNGYSYSAQQGWTENLVYTDTPGTFSVIADIFCAALAQVNSAGTYLGMASAATEVLLDGGVWDNVTATRVANAARVAAGTTTDHPVAFQFVDRQTCTFDYGEGVFGRTDASVSAYTAGITTDTKAESTGWACAGFVP
jgi:hypothetical protein